MKKFLLFINLILVTYMCFPYSVQGQNRKVNSVSKLSVSSLNGYWKRISIINDGKPEDVPLPQLRLYNDGYYIYIGQDSTHNWTRTFSGIYEIDNGLYKETTRYSGFPNIVGNTHWQEIKITGDTLSLKYFKKMIDSTGKQLPPSTYTREVVLVKMKKSARPY